MLIPASYKPDVAQASICSTYLVIRLLESNSYCSRCRHEARLKKSTLKRGDWSWSQLQNSLIDKSLPKCSIVEEKTCLLKQGVSIRSSVKRERAMPTSKSFTQTKRETKDLGRIETATNIISYPSVPLSVFCNKLTFIQQGCGKHWAPILTPHTPLLAASLA